MASTGNCTNCHECVCVCIMSKMLLLLPLVREVQQVRLQGSHVSLSLSVKAYESERENDWCRQRQGGWMQLEELRCISHSLHSVWLPVSLSDVKGAAHKAWALKLEEWNIVVGAWCKKGNHKIVALLIESTRASSEYVCVCKDNYFGKHTAFELKYFRFLDCMT